MANLENVEVTRDSVPTGAEPGFAPAVWAVRGGSGFLKPEPFQPEGPVVFIPLRLGRRCGRRTIVHPPGTPPGTESGREDIGAIAAKPPSAKANPLMLVLARAFRWRAHLDAGTAATHKELAQRYNVSRSYISRVLRLTTLPPDIVEAILESRDPSGLSVELLHQTDFPDDWPGQRRALGFPERV